MEIRLLKAQEEYRAAEQFQLDVWGFEPSEITPSTELIVAQKHGGLVMGAFDASGRMAGFLFGWVGRRNGKVYHYSRMTGVIREQRDAGLGFRLKQEQRRWALEQGFDLVCWTFDPLQSRNGHFNLQKLGVISREYLVNFYGENSSHFNRGLDTDRFQAEWWIGSPRVARRMEGEVSPPPESGVRVEIPPDIDVTKERDLEEARRWRARSREQLRSEMAAGGVVSGFERRDGRSHVVLERKSLEELLA